MADDHRPVSTGTPHPVALDPRAYLSVRVFFHRQPIQGLPLRFYVVGGAHGELTGAQSANLVTDAQGRAWVDASVALGVYLCQIDYQDYALVPTVPSVDKPFSLVLPIGLMPAYDTGGDREVLDIGES